MTRITTNFRRGLIYQTLICLVHFRIRLGHFRILFADFRKTDADRGNFLPISAK